MNPTVLSAMQRQAPPIDKTHPRRGEAGGGYEVARPRTLAVGLEDERPRLPGTVFDKLVGRARWPWMKRSSYMAAGDSWVNWTAAGPPRPELRMVNFTLRPMVGNSTSRFPTVDTPTHGMHTNIPSGVSRTAPRYQAVPQQRPTRQFRLRAGQYTGQTYSQTTRSQGR